ncbi:hypothetical protein DUB37_13425, partial [Salmonella enterica subsp. enterica serovar Amager]|nr:hypothetical protein [Salmonella enterica subsp. enterica serovar Amager]
LPGISLVKKPILTDGLFCVCGNCKNVGLISAAPSGNRHRRMAAPPYSAYSNYPAYEAGALVEPTRAQPTQSLTMNYPLHVLI